MTAHTVIHQHADSTGSPLTRFGFGGRLGEAFPSQIIMDITEVCNLGCIHCPHPAFKVSHRYARRMLDPALNSKMVDEVRREGAGRIRYIRYTSNGEPLIHPQSYDMIEHAVRESGVFVTLTTNGTILNERRMRRLLAAGVHMVDISLDAFRDETYAAIRVGGDLAVTRANVLRLIAWRDEQKADTRVVVSFVEQPGNTAEIDAFRRFWTEAGADEVVIRRLHTCASANETLAASRAGEAGERRPCLYPWERLVIGAGGELSFCPSDWVHGSRIGDFRQITIAEAWRGDFMQRLRQAHLENSFGGFDFCGRCPDWASTRWPHEGRSYADMIDDFIGAEGE